jgi:hypothetical protein
LRIPTAKFQTLQLNSGAGICDIVTVQEFAPALSPKNSSAPLAIFVLPMDLRSLISFMGVLDEFFVDPMATIVAPPNLSMDEPPCYRSPRDNYGP